MFCAIDKSENKDEIRWLGSGVIVGRFGNECAIVHFRGAYLEVALYDMRSENRLLEVLGCDGASQLHLHCAKSTMHYSVVRQTLIPLSENEQRNSEP